MDCNTGKTTICSSILMHVNTLTPVDARINCSVELAKILTHHATESVQSSNHHSIWFLLTNNHILYRLFHAYTYTFM